MLPQIIADFIALHQACLCQCFSQCRVHRMASVSLQKTQPIDHVKQHVELIRAAEVKINLAYGGEEARLALSVTEGPYSPLTDESYVENMTRQGKCMARACVLHWFNWKRLNMDRPTNIASMNAYGLAHFNAINCIQNKVSLKWPNGFVFHIAVTDKDKLPIHGEFRRLDGDMALGGFLQQLRRFF